MEKKERVNILSIIKGNINLLIITAILSIIVSFLNVSLINFEKSLADAILAQNKDLFVRTIEIVVAIIFSKIFLEYIKAYLFGKFSEKSLRDLRIKIGEKLIKTPLDYIEKNTSGDFISRLSNDLFLIQNFIGGSLNDLLYHPVTFIMGLVLAFSISWKLTLFCFTVIPLTIFLSIIISAPVEKFTQRQQDAFGSVNTVSQDAISGITILKSFNLQKELYKKYIMELNKAFKEGLRSAKFEVLLEPTKTILQIGPFLLMFFYGGNLVLKGEMTMGGIIASIELLNVFLAPVNVLPNVINSYRKAKAAGQRIEEILVQKEEKLGEIKEEGKNNPYAIEFENVSFSYDGSKEVLKDINFKIKKGEKIAIVGESGRGKSTIVKLILGFYKPNQGDIKVLGISLKDWNLEKLREKISVVNQDVYLFPESFKENIRYGKYNAKDEEIISSAKKALAYDFIIEEHGGFDKEIGERGVNLSGGQKQRIAIARALLKNADIFIFDEATSALDTELESIIQNTLKEELKEKTLIIIAHRFSSTKIADRVIMLEDGKMKECEER